MNMIKFPLRMAEGGGAAGGTGGAADWRASIPEDIRTHASMKDIVDIPTLAKSYVHAQTLIGSEKILKPQKTWGEKDWNTFYQQLGRPENADGYSFKVEADKLPEGVSIDDNRLKETKASLHKLGLTDSQASGVLQYYLESVGRSATESKTSADTAKQQALIALKQEFGANYDSKVNLAQAVVKKFGSPELQAKLEEIGNDPHFVKLFAAIGESMMDDTARGSGAGLIVTDATSALQEINQLKGDTEFQGALGNRQHPGHKNAVERWAALHEKAFPSK